MSTADPSRRSAPRRQYRHRLPVRITHWINVLAVLVMLMSGLQIFNAYPQLYWGRSSYTGSPPLLAMYADRSADGPRGMTEVLGHRFDTTGVLGLSRGADGALRERGFPQWATLPGPQWLAMGRRWHLLFAWVLVINGLIYLLWSLGSGHLSRDLAPTRRDWRSIGRSLLDHLRLRHPTGEAATRYNVLQKLAYLAVIFVVVPLLVVMGMALSPWLNSLYPGWVDVVGGRQSARTLHFLAAWALVAFVLVHLFEVIVTGLWNNLRSMITGRYRVPQDSHGPS